MSIAKRFGALLFFIAIYQALFFVPLASAPDVLGAESSNSLSAIIFGVSPHAFHYQSLGLLPFVFGSLFVSFVGMAYKPWRELDKQGSFGAKRKALISGQLTYAFGFVMSLAVAYKTGYEITGYHFWLVVGELMLALQTLKFIFDKVQSLKVATSGVSVFFGLNIVTVFIRDITILLGFSYNPSTFVMLFSTLYLGALTVYLTYKFIYGKVMLGLEINKPSQGVRVFAPLTVQLSQTGIMPIIFSVMITSLFSSFFLMTKAGEDPIFSHWVSALLFLCLLLITSFYFTNQKLSPKELVNSLSKDGVSLAGEKPSKAIERLFVELSRLRNNIVLYQTAFLFLMVLGQSCWSLWANSTGFPAVGFVAGINWFLIMSVFADMSKQYDKLRISS